MRVLQWSNLGSFLLMLHCILDRLIVEGIDTSTVAARVHIVNQIRRVAHNMRVMGRYAKLAQELSPTGYMFIEMGRQIITRDILQQIMPTFLPQRKVKDSHCNSLLEWQVQELKQSLEKGTTTAFATAHLQSARLALRLSANGWSAPELDSLSTRALSIDFGPVDLIAISPEDLAARIRCNPLSVDHEML